MSKHTPGPWKSKLTRGSVFTLCTIYSRPAGRAVARGVRPEDASLIEYAPDLISACEAILAWAESSINPAGTDFIEFAAIKQAIKRAKGD